MKKIISMLCVLLTFLMAFPLTSFAAESKIATLDYTVESSYTVTLPEYIEANVDGQELKISNAVIPFGYEVDVTAEFDNQLKLREANGVTIPYTLFADDEAVTSGNSILKQMAGASENVTTTLSAKVSTDAIYAGVYTATVNFNIDVKEIIQTNYTAEEIENNPLLYGIGLTKPEYVVAQFSEDYSTVLVTKNGEDSDGRMKGFEARKSPFSLNKETLKSVFVKEGVTTIGSCAFYECETTTQISLPDGITKIADNSFYHCTALEEIYLSDTILAIDRLAFSGCKALTELTLPKDLTIVSHHAFSNCTSLEMVVLGDKVKKIDSHAFGSCQSLKTINLPEGLESIGVWSFRYCYALEHVTLPETVTSLGWCAFGQCKNLKTINIPESITVIEDSLFSDCYSLESIVIPSGVTSIGKWGFSHCRNITSLELPESLDSIDTYAFSSMSKLESFSISENNEYFCTVDGILYSKDMTKLHYFPLAKDVTEFTVPSSVTTIGTVAFGRHTTLTDIYVYETVTTIEDGMFGNANRPMVHTPVGSAMEQYCIDNNITYDNVMI